MLIKLILILALTQFPPCIAGEIVVVGLFKDKAILSIDGKQRRLAVGQTSQEGVKLLSANSKEAVLEIAGERRLYALGSPARMQQFAAPEVTTVRLRRNPQGMYSSTGSINGVAVNFLVDTGASLIAMNAIQAKRLSLDYQHRGRPIAVSTASGMAQGYQIELKRVKLGDIELRDIDAVVLAGESPPEILLGMSFLGKLDIQHNGQGMQLTKK